MARVKICGVTSIKDALMCAELGADAVGTIVEVPVDTPRKISTSKASEIVASLPLFVDSVAVVMPKSVEEAIGFFREIEPTALQLHRKESPEFVRKLKESISCRIIKSIPIRDESSLEDARVYSELCDAILLDSPSPKLGGSGETHNWELSRAIVRELKVPVILAGGLTPENVADAVAFVRPYAVDVSSGVEIEGEKGKKDYTKVKEFIERARG
ncbi:MAG: phosphoribosylanthranilate isomerase [Candidatus Hydrothermarchaeales archaeon]